MINLKNFGNKRVSGLTESSEYILEVEKLSKTFEIKKGLFKRKELNAVREVSFNVLRGETLGIVGESGCGKSTLGGILTKLIDPTSGKVLFEGGNIHEVHKNELRSLRKDFQIIFQDPYSSLNPRMTIKDIIAEPLITHDKLSEKELYDRVVRILNDVGLSDAFLDRYPHQMSGGQRQRVVIGRALALNPKLIVCDEPVSALDVSVQAQILNLLKSIQKRYNLTFIFIAHGIPAVSYMSDRVAVMYLGEIVEIGRKDEIINNPEHPYTKLLLDSVPVYNPRQRSNKEIVLGDPPNPLNLPSGCVFRNRCPIAREKCTTISPKLLSIHHKHEVACHYPLSEYKKVNGSDKVD